jgi:hypothetical protein
MFLVLLIFHDKKPIQLYQAGSWLNLGHINQEISYPSLAEFFGYDL